MKIRMYVALLSLLLMVSGGFSLALADDNWRDDNKIKVEGKAKSGGKISFKVSYKPSEKETAADPVEVDVLVAEKTKKNEIAKLITNNFQAALGKEKFKVTQSWGNNVIIKAKGDTPDFKLEITNNSVQGVSLEIDD